MTEEKNGMITTLIGIGGVMLGAGTTYIVGKLVKKKEKKALEKADPDKKAEILEEIQKCKETMKTSHKFSNAYQDAVKRLTDLTEKFFGK